MQHSRRSFLALCAVPALRGFTPGAPPVPQAYIDLRGNVIFRGVRVGTGYHLDLHPSGNQLLMTHDTNPQPKRQILLVDQTGQSKVIASGYVHTPRWSPDGKQIAFMQYDEKDWNLMVAPADNPQAAKLILRKAGTFTAWTPDGHALLVQDYPAGLRYISLDGKVLRQVSFEKLYGQEYDWSSSNRIIPHPTDPDTLLCSALRMESVPQSDKDEMDRTENVFLYQLSTGKRTAVPNARIYGQDPA